MTTLALNSIFLWLRIVAAPKSAGLSGPSGRGKATTTWQVRVGRGLSLKSKIETVRGNCLTNPLETSLHILNSLALNFKPLPIFWRYELSSALPLSTSTATVRCLLADEETQLIIYKGGWKCPRVPRSNVVQQRGDPGEKGTREVNLASFIMIPSRRKLSLSSLELAFPGPPAPGTKNYWLCSVGGGQGAGRRPQRQ